MPAVHGLQIASSTNKVRITNFIDNLIKFCHDVPKLNILKFKIKAAWYCGKVISLEGTKAIMYLLLVRRAF